MFRLTLPSLAGCGSDGRHSGGDPSTRTRAGRASKSERLVASRSRVCCSCGARDGAALGISECSRRCRKPEKMGKGPRRFVGDRRRSVATSRQENASSRGYNDSRIASLVSPPSRRFDDDAVRPTSRCYKLDSDYFGGCRTRMYPPGGLPPQSLTGALLYPRSRSSAVAFETHRKGLSGGPLTERPERKGVARVSAVCVARSLCSVGGISSPVRRYTLLRTKHSQRCAVAYRKPRRNRHVGEVWIRRSSAVYFYFVEKPARPRRMAGFGIRWRSIVRAGTKITQLATRAFSGVDADFDNQDGLPPLPSWPALEIEAPPAFSSMLRASHSVGQVADSSRRTRRSAGGWIYCSGGGAHKIAGDVEA